MSAEANTELVRRWYAAIARGDLDAVLAPLAEDVRLWVAGPPDVLPFAGERRGHASVTALFATLREAAVIELNEPHEFIAQGDKVVVLGRHRARVRRTGRVYDAGWVQVFTLRDGAVTAFEEYGDTAAWVTAYADDAPAEVAG